MILHGDYAFYYETKEKSQDVSCKPSGILLPKFFDI